jgi:hypothetical protein
VGEGKHSKTPAPQTPWTIAAQMFPRIPFPWEVLPGDIADSLQQLGRACATSAYALPGAPSARWRPFLEERWQFRLRRAGRRH